MSEAPVTAGSAAPEGAQAQKSKWESKLMWLGFVIAVLGGAQAGIGDAPIDPKVSGSVASGIGILIMVLRKFYTKAELK